jgi:hypothetical protein
MGLAAIVTAAATGYSTGIGTDAAFPLPLGWRLEFSADDASLFGYLQVWEKVFCASDVTKRVE